MTVHSLAVLYFISVKLYVLYVEIISDKQIEQRIDF